MHINFSLNCRDLIERHYNVFPAAITRMERRARTTISSNSRATLHKTVCDVLTRNICNIIVMSLSETAGVKQITQMNFFLVINHNIVHLCK